MSDDMLNKTGKKLAEELDITEGELIGRLKSTQYNLSWMMVKDSTLEPKDQELDEFKHNIGKAYRGMVESLQDALDYNSIGEMEKDLQSADSSDGEKFLNAVNVLQNVYRDGLVEADFGDYSTPEVYVDSMDEAISLGQRLSEAKSSIESTELHKQLQNS